MTPPLNDQTRAVYYVAERASAFKMRLLVPCLLFGLVLGFFGVDAAITSDRFVLVVLAFVGPVLASLFMSAGLAELWLPRLARQWMAEAAELFRVPRQPLMAVIRRAMLSS